MLHEAILSDWRKFISKCLDEFMQLSKSAKAIDVPCFTEMLEEIMDSAKKREGENEDGKMQDETEIQMSEIQSEEEYLKERKKKMEMFNHNNLESIKTDVKKEDSFNKKTKKNTTIKKTRENIKNKENEKIKDVQEIEKIEEVKVAEEVKDKKSKERNETEVKKSKRKKRGPYFKVKQKTTIKPKTEEEKIEQKTKPTPTDLSLNKENKKLKDFFQELKEKHIEKSILESQIEEKVEASLNSGSDIYKSVIGNQIKSQFKKPNTNIDYSSYIPKTTIPKIVSDKENEMVPSHSTPDWVKDPRLNYYSRTQDHSELEQFYESEEIDVTKIFPKMKNITNYSPNKIRKRKIGL